MRKPLLAGVMGAFMTVLLFVPGVKAALAQTASSNPSKVDQFLNWLPQLVSSSSSKPLFGDTNASQPSADLQSGFGKLDRWFKETTGLSLSAILLAVWRFFLWLFKFLYDLISGMVAGALEILKKNL